MLAPTTMVVDMTDDEITTSINMARAAMRYYEAAEGEQWFREAGARNATEAYLVRLGKEAEERSLSMIEPAF